MTTKGTVRRAALVDAAAELLGESGWQGVSHRAVAARAGLPLAATTYYFASLDELVVAASEQSAAQHLAQARARLDLLPARPLGPGPTARRVVDMVLGDAAASPSALSGLYERYLQAGRVSSLRPVVARWNAALREVVATALARGGYDLDPTTALALVDGLTVTALAEGRAEPAAFAARGLSRLLAR